MTTAGAQSIESGLARWWPAALVAVALLVALHARLHRPASTDRLELAANQMRGGHLPLWDSSNGTGEPLLARGGVAAFSPTVIPLLRVPSRKIELPQAWRWPAREALRLLLAGFGAALVARRWGAGGVVILLVGACYIACGAVLAQLRDTAAEAWAWLPWCALAMGAAIRVARPARIALVALVFGVGLLPGDVGASIALVIVCLGFVAGELRRPAALARVPAALFGVALGFGLSGIVWLPWWELRRSPPALSPVKPPAAAWFVRNYQWVPTRAEAARRAADHGFNPKSIVLLDEQTPPEWSATVAAIRADPPATNPAGSFFFARRGDVPIKVADTTPGHWRVVLPDEDGWMLIAQTYTPDWVGTISMVNRFGKSARDIVTLPADGGLIAVPTHDQGAGELQLDYRPRAWRQGAVVSGAAAALCCLLVGLSIAGPRRARVSAPAESAIEDAGRLTYAAPPV